MIQHRVTHCKGNLTGRAARQAQGRQRAQLARVRIGVLPTCTALQLVPSLTVLFGESLEDGTLRLHLLK